MNRINCNNFLKDANESDNGECCKICDVCSDFDNIFPTAQEMFVRDCKECIYKMDIETIEERICNWCNCQEQE